MLNTMMPVFKDLFNFVTYSTNQKVTLSYEMLCFKSSVLFNCVTHSPNQALPNPVPMGIF